jgi:hypothetical protein
VGVEGKEPIAVVIRRRKYALYARASKTSKTYIMK